MGFILDSRFALPIINDSKIEYIAFPFDDILLLSHGFPPSVDFFVVKTILPKPEGHDSFFMTFRNENCKR
jgi:hypothetical protein